MLLTMVGLLAAAVMFFVARKEGWQSLARFAVGAAVLGVGIYVALLLWFSLLSKERTLALNEPKEFCGFYLDCHLHAAVADVKRLKTIEQITARGVFYVVKVRVFSNAKRATMGLLKPWARVTDANGRIYERDAAAEAAWEKLAGLSAPFDQKVGPQGGSLTKDLVFDVPADAPAPGLQLTEGYAIDYLLETFLIGDEDSLFHKPVKFSLESHPATARQ
jgi:hypothetical protein